MTTDTENIKKLGELRIRPAELLASYPPRYSNRYKATKCDIVFREQRQKLNALEQDIVMARFSLDR